MHLSGFTDSLASLGQPPDRCPSCNSSLRVRQKLCLSCLLHAGIGNGESSEDDSFVELLGQIKTSETSWRIGNYEILGEIGRGGTGVIYRARQRHSRRVVALKRILACHGESAEMLARFRREAEAAASLDHPNILPIYEVGESDEGAPFFSMKFAPGGSLQEVGPALRQEPRRIVELMAKVARAVQYAHDQGILHRDLKPGNILLDGRGEPLVSDFGLAKWLDASSDLTRTLTIFGTPGYIAPEQAEGPAAKLRGTADIYSLGAILFELLAARPPFRGENALAVIHQAGARTAPKLRSLVTHIDRDLETICAHCLEREPETRYQSAAALAEDLERWLDKRPIVARPVSAPVRLARWSRRNPILAQSAAAIIILFVLSVSLFVWQLRTQAATKAEMAKLRLGVLEYAQLETQLRQPGEGPMQAVVYAQLGKDLGVDAKMLGEKLPQFAAHYKNAPGASSYERANAAYVAKDYAEAERLALLAASQARQATPSDPKVVAQAFTLAGLSAERLVQYARAMQHFTAAEQLTDPNRNSEEWAAVQNAIADLLFAEGKFTDAERLFRRVIATRSKVLGPEHPDTLASRNRLIYALNNAEKHTEAETEAREVVALREKILGSEHPDTLLSRCNLANALYHSGKFAQAEAIYRPLVELDTRIIGSEHPRTLAARVGLANSLNDQGKFDEAEKGYRDVIRIDSKVYGPEHPVTLNDRLDLATLLQARHSYPAADAEYRAVIKLQERVIGPDHADTLNTRNNFAELLDDEGKYAEAEAVCRSILDPEQKAVGPTHRLTLNTRANLAVALIGEGKVEPAAGEYGEVMKLMEQVLGIDYPDTVNYTEKIARGLARQKRSEAALAIAQGAAERASTTLGPNSAAAERYARLVAELRAPK